MLISSYDGIIPDFEKALCYITGEPFETSEYNTSTYKWETKGINSVNSSINRKRYYRDWETATSLNIKATKTEICKIGRAHV